MRDTLMFFQREEIAGTAKLRTGGSFHGNKNVYTWGCRYMWVSGSVQLPHMRVGHTYFGYVEELNSMYVSIRIWIKNYQSDRRHFPKPSLKLTKGSLKIPYE